MGPAAVVNRQLSPWEALRYRLVVAALWLGRYLGERDLRFGD